MANLLITFYFFNYVFTFFQSLILEPAFCDADEAWETKDFLPTGDRQRAWGGDRMIPGRPHWVLLGNREDFYCWTIQMPNPTDFCYLVSVL